MTVRGIRNNNPTNIRHSPTVWQGQSPDQSGDKDFVTFLTPVMGLRAPIRELLTYQNRYGLKTVRGVVNRWAPPVENNTGAYVAAVAAQMGVGADDVLSLEDADTMRAMLKALIQHENGSQPYTDAQIDEAMRLAGVSSVPKPKLAAKASFQAHAGAGVALTGAGCLEACTQFAGHAATFAPQVKDAADKLSAFTGSPAIQHVVTVLLTVAGGLTAAGLVAEWLKHRSA